MKRIQLALAALWLSCIAGIAATSLGNVPISQMPIATNVLETAWFPIIQPLPGRTTNDNFRVNLPTLRQSIGVGDTLWTNANQVYTPTQFQSNLVAYGVESYFTLDARGAFITSLYQNPVLLAAGTNALSAANIGYLLLQASTTTASDTILRLDSGSALGQHLWLQNYTSNAFTLFNGDELTDNAAQHLVLSGGNWTPSVPGDTIVLFRTILGWSEERRFGGSTNVVTSDLWATDGTYLYPQNPVLFPLISQGLYVDTNTFTWWGAPVPYSGDVLVSMGPDDSGQTKDIVVGVFDPASASLNDSSLRYTAGPNISTLQLFSQLGGDDYRSLGFSVGVPAYWYLTDTVGGLSTNLFFYDPAGLQGVATWRLGGYTNATLPVLALHNGDVDATDNAILTVEPNGSIAIGTSTLSDFGGDLGGLSIAHAAHTELGETDNAGFWFQGLTNNNTMGLVSGVARTSGAVLSTLWQTNGFQRGFAFSVGPDFMFVQASDTNGTTRIYMDPHADDAITSLAYVFDTETPWSVHPIAAIRNAGTNILTFGPLEQVNFSTTNVLYRSGSDLHYTNGLNTTVFGYYVDSPNGSAVFGVNGSNGQAVVEPTGLNVPVFIHAGGAASGLFVGATALQPGAENISIGANTSNGAFTNSFVKGETHIVGQNDGLGNYAWVRCFVTNGIAVFDFANGGSGVAPTSISFRTNGVEVGHFP